MWWFSKPVKPERVPRVQLVKPVKPVKPKSVYRQNVIGTGNIQVGGRITINGRSFTAPPGKNLSIINGEVFVDGKKLDDPDVQEAMDKTTPIKIEWHGPPPEHLQVQGDAEIHGDIKGSVDAGRDVRCKNIEGNVNAGNSVVGEQIGKNVDAGGSVNCGNVEGNVDAGGSVNCANVKGRINAGGSVSARS